jgi:hypothetical protein
MKYFLITFLSLAGFILKAQNSQSEADRSNLIDQLVIMSNSYPSQESLEAFIKKHDLEETIKTSYELLSQRIPDANNRYLLFITTSYVFYDKARFEDAQAIALIALKAAEECGSHKRVASAYSMMGNIFSELRVPNEAVSYLKKAITALESEGDSVKAPVFNNLANAFYRSAEYHPENYDSAKKYNYKALAIAKKFNIKSQELRVYQSLGLIESDLTNFKEAENALRLAGQLCLELKDEESYGYNCYQLGRMFSMSDLPHAGDSAVHYLNKASVFARASQDPSFMNEIFYQLSQAYYLKGDYKTSADYAIRFAEYNDSLSLLKNSKDIAELSEKYESAKKEATIKELNLQQLEKQEQINRQVYMIIAAVVILVFVIIVSFVLYRTSRLRKKANQELIEKNILIESQKQKVEEQSKLIQEKNKEIIDSIRYAQRIQKALLPNERMLRRIFKRNINNP